MKRRNVLAQARAEDVTAPQGHSPVVVAAAVPGLSARAPTAMNQGLAGVETTAVDSTNSSDLMAAVATSTGTNGTTSGEDASLVKKRRTKNFKWREDMAKKSRSGVGIVTPVAPLEPVTFANWDEFIRVWTDYMVQTKTLYRRRSSCSTASWNSKNRFKTLPVPDSFQYATMAYWCTHGCIQPSRGTGVRAHLHNRFTGCTARITADVVYEKTEESQVRWFIRVRNQISQHNHRISDEIFNCYSNNSSVPDEMLLGPGDDATPRQQDVQAYYSTAGDIEVAGVPSQGDTVAAAVAPVATASRTGAPFVSSSVLSKEVLADEQKISMAQSEIQPLLDELRRTPSRVIHKRLQDVSEFVLHLVSKWERDRTNEERHLHFITQSATNATTGDQPRLASSRLTAETNGEGDHTDGNNQDDSPQHIDSEVI